MLTSLYRIHVLLSLSTGLPALKPICSAFEYVGGLSVLKIQQHGASLSREVAEAVSRGLEFLEELQELSLIGIHIDEPAAKALAPGFASLTELDSLQLDAANGTPLGLYPTLHHGHAIWDGFNGRTNYTPHVHLPHVRRRIISRNFQLATHRPYKRNEPILFAPSKGHNPVKGQVKIPRSPRHL